MLNPKLFDHTLLKADVTLEDIDRVVDEAIEHRFASVCVNSYYTKHVADRLKGINVNTCTVVGFPLGQMSTRAKVMETACAVEDGADEIDMVINIAALKDGLYDFVKDEIMKVGMARGSQAKLKVIIETCLLTNEEKMMACELAKAAGADFVKTSTGFSTGGATIEDVMLMREIVGGDMGVKASGGIRDAETAAAMVMAGADRLGTSATVTIVT